MTRRHDRELGMDRRISRRDFLNGMALGTAGIRSAPDWLRALVLAEGTEAASAVAYPPELTGLRGSHEGSYAAAHALRDGTFWATAGRPHDTGERYDLVVVGAGLSGLAAAHFFRKRAGSKTRILVLDNHDDFGGHARRNEFRQAGRLLIGYGGTFAIDSPAPYSVVAKSVLADLGVDVGRASKVLDRALYPSLGLSPGIFFDKETFGADRLLADPGRERAGESAVSEAKDPWPAFMAEAPLPDVAKRDLARLYKEAIDYLPGLSSAEKKSRLARMSYADFLTSVASIDRAALPFFQARTHGLYGVGIDAVPAQDAWGLGLPGFQGMGLDPAPGRGMNRDAIPDKEAEAYFFHFPDGNASLARLLVRGLVPQAVPGRTADDVVAARVAYGRLDDPGAKARIRLESTVVRVAHRGDPASSREVEVSYARGNALETVRARRVVLACWNGVIPYLCPELPDAQKQALAYGVKVPIVYTNVVIRRWTSFARLGVYTIHAPGGFNTSVNLDLPVSLGDYNCPRDPEEPIVLHLMRTPCSPGLTARDQHRAGRMELLAMSFADFERPIRDQLARMLGPGGFDPARDIAAITVNRWPHGYAYQYNSLWDPFWLEDGELPCVVARRPFGRIAIANADADAYSYTDAAFDQAHRAVTELMALEG